MRVGEVLGLDYGAFDTGGDGVGLRRSFEEVRVFKRAEDSVLNPEHGTQTIVNPETIGS